MQHCKTDREVLTPALAWIQVYSSDDLTLIWYFWYLVLIDVFLSKRKVWGNLQLWEKGSVSCRCPPDHSCQATFLSLVGRSVGRGVVLGLLKVVSWFFTLCTSHRSWLSLKGRLVEHLSIFSFVRPHTFFLKKKKKKKPSKTKTVVIVIYSRFSFSVFFFFK